MNGSVLAWLVSIALLPFSNRSPLHLLSLSIDSPQKERKKEKKTKRGPLLLAGHEEKKLGSTSLFVHFPLQIQQAFSHLCLPPPPTTAMTLAAAAALSFLLCV